MAMLDEDTELVPDGARSWKGEISDRWSVVGPNGGYLAAFITRALMEAAPFPDPLVLNVHFVARANPGPARVEVDVVREGRSHATLAVRLWQGEVVAAGLATFGVRREEGRELCAAIMPSIAPPDECALASGPALLPGVTIRDRFEVRLPPDSDPDYGGVGDGSPVSGSWRRMLDREVDDLAVPLFMDAAPPSVWAATGRGAGAPTVELTVHWRSRPHTRWHLNWFSTSSLRGGYFVEDGQLWGEDGQLVAESRQLARFIEA
jgi:acyl-CoA thioesterase